MESTTNLTPKVKFTIANTITWARYAAILSFISLGLSLLQLVVGAFKGNLNLLGTIFSFIVSALITFVLSINLLNYSKLAKVGISSDDSTSFYQSLYHLRIYFSVMGILFLVALGLILLFILIAIIAGLVALAN